MHGIGQPRGMPVLAALEVLAAHRQPNQIVVTNQGSARLWPQLSQHPLDFNYNPSTMGGAIPLALGLALSQPDKESIVISGEGSLLMSLGTLVTVVASGAKNFTIVLLDNAMYEVTGEQKTAASGVAVDWAGMARAAGFSSAAAFDELAAWQTGIAELLKSDGPRFVALRVQPAGSELLSHPTPPLAEQLTRLRTALAPQSPETAAR